MKISSSFLKIINEFLIELFITLICLSLSFYFFNNKTDALAHFYLLSLFVATVFLRDFNIGAFKHGFEPILSLARRNIFLLFIASLYFLMFGSSSHMSAFYSSLLLIMFWSFFCFGFLSFLYSCRMNEAFAKILTYSFLLSCCFSLIWFSKYIYYIEEYSDRLSKYNFLVQINPLLQINYFFNIDSLHAGKLYTIFESEYPVRKPDGNFAFKFLFALSFTFWCASFIVQYLFPSKGLDEKKAANVSVVGPQ